MTNFVSRRSLGTFVWRGKSLSFPEINSILNLLDSPVLLFDLNHWQIFGANSKFFTLTAFTQNEVVGVSLLNFIPDLSQIELIDNETLSVTLVRHQRESLKVLLQKIVLDNNNQWMLLVITPLDSYQQAQSKALWQQDLMKSLLKLASLGSQSEFSQALPVAIECGQSILNASLISIYSGNVQLPKFQKIISSEPTDNPIFPDSLTSGELIRLQTPALWRPGKKVTSDLQRLARLANLQFLATLPLGQSGAWVGLIVVGDTKLEPLNDLMNLLEIFGANITSLMEHQLYLDNSHKHLQNNKQVLAINSSIAENVQEGIVILNENLTITDVNPASELILGYASQEMIGQPVENILIGSETLSSALKTALQGISTQNLGNLKLHHRDGHAFPAHIKTIPVHLETSAKENLVGIIIFINDLSENEQIRIQTQQLEQRAVLGEVTAIFAHEVRNPINNISTGLQVMAMNIGENDSIKETISRMENDCSRLTALMDSVLSFSRPIEYKSDPIDLSLLLTRILDRWRPRLAHAKIQPFFQSNVTSPFILGEPRALEQVFTNLISNAVQAMKEDGGTLAIKIIKGKPAQEPPQYEITVSDTGHGIPDEIRDHIFKPFVTTNQEGTGLGLAITKRIITAHRGSIGVNSFPGGTVFTISLPEYIKEKL